MAQKPTYEELEHRNTQFEKESLILKKEMAALKEQLKLSRIILSATPELLVLKDRNSIYQAVNPAFCEFVGKMEKDIIGKSDFDVFPRSEADMYRRDDQRVMETGKPQIQDEEVTGEDGTRWLQVAKTPIQDKNGKSTGVLCSVIDITQRKRSEKILRRTEYEKKIILDSLLELVVYTDLDMKVIWANQAACKSVNITRNNLIGRHCYELWADGPEVCSDCVVVKAVKTGKVQEIEKTTPDGRSWFNRGYPVKDEKDNIIGGIEVVLDITEHKQAEEALRESEEKFSKAFMAGPYNIIITRMKDGRIIDVNEHFISDTGFTKNEIIGKTTTEIGIWTFADDRKFFVKMLQDKGEVNDLETYFRLKDGTIAPYIVSSRPIDLKGEKCAISITHNITDLKRTEEALRESEERFRNVYNTAPLAFVVWDKNTRVADWNKRAEEVFGWTKEEVVGHNFFDFLIPEKDRPHVEDVVDILIKGELLSHSINDNLTKEGEIITCEWNNSALHDDNGNIIGAISLGLDITDRKQLEEELRQSHKMEAIGTLAGGIAHDFNNMLGIILGNTELAMDDVPEWNPARLNLEEIITASLRAKDVVRQLLSFSRKTDQERKPIKINPIVTDALKLLRSSIPTSIEIRSNIPKESQIIFADPTQINQVMINLCTNAAQAMEEDGGILEISLDSMTLDESTAQSYELSPGRYVKLTVNDTGHGIAPEIKDRIFDPYFTTREFGKGSGMGLAVVHGIVTNHNGTIWVDSEIGKGTTFNVFLPIVEREPVPEITIDEDLPAGKERILFVDDEESIVKMGSQRLERLGYQVESTTSSLDALDLFRSKPDHFDLVLIDLTMPKMTGDKLVKEILNIRPDMRIIICTGFSEKMDGEKAREIGASGYLEKPHEKRSLARMVRQVLDRK